MIYRIEKYNKKRKCWILIYSSSNFDYVNEVLHVYLKEHRNSWIRLSTVFKSE